MANSEFGVVFDVDGVLVDSYLAHFESWRRMARENGWTMTEEQFARTFGRTSRETIEVIWGHVLHDRSLVPRLDQRKETIFRQLLVDSFPAMKGARELIAHLDDERLALAVGSSGPPENVALVMRQVDPHQRIRAIVTGQDVDRGKPDPQVFLLAAERLRIRPANCLVVEDAQAGIQAAAAAGMKSIGVVSTGRTHRELCDADCVVECLTEITASQIRDILGGD